MKYVCLLGVLTIVLLGPAAEAARAASYGAIAYSPSTGSIGTSWNCRNFPQAEALARWNCGVDDAVVVSVRNGYCALALADDGSWGTGYGATRRQAELRVLRSCRQATDTSCYIAQWLFSGR